MAVEAVWTTALALLPLLAYSRTRRPTLVTLNTMTDLLNALPMVRLVELFTEQIFVQSETTSLSCQHVELPTSSLGLSLSSG